MQTQRDHVHAQTFMVGRISSALVEGDPTGAQIPGQRLQTGLVVGLMLAVLLVGGFAVYGWIVPGGSSAYRQPGAILVEKETGNRYVYLGDGALHPTPDLTSAMLIQNGGTVKLISRESLKGIPRGHAVGVEGGPARLPSPDALVSGPWLTCLPTVKGGGLGFNLEPGTPAQALTDDAFTVVRASATVRYLVTTYMKYKIADEAVLVALGAAASDPPTAPAAWLESLGSGQDLAPAEIPGAGTTGPSIGGRKHPIGALFRQRAVGGIDQLFVLRSDGLAPMSRTEFLIADAAGPGTPIELDPADLVGAARSADNSLLERLPDLASRKPQMPGGRSVCLRQRPVSSQSYSSEVVFVERGLSGVYPTGQGAVLTRIGSGMVVTPSPAPSPDKKGPVSFISDQGIVYRLADDDAANALKLGSVTPVPFPAQLLQALPQGAVLSRKAVVALPKG